MTFSKMKTVNKLLSLEERTAAETFFERIREKDTTNVKRLIGVVDAHANDYFSSGELETAYHYFEGREAFFLVYGIGGNVSKNYERPDVDVMIVTNMRYKEGFLEGYDDQMDDPYFENNIEPLWRKIYQKFQPDMEVKKESELPDNYNLGVTKGKCIITLTPKNGARKIDVVYVKSMVARADPSIFPWETEELPSDDFDYSRCSFNSENSFVSKDIGLDNQPLAKILLYRANTKDIKKAAKELIY